jgi:hypothetical protein
MAEHNAAYCNAVLLFRFVNLSSVIYNFKEIVLQRQNRQAQGSRMSFTPLYSAPSRCDRTQKVLVI